jgi:hypothetical protein
MGEGKGEGGKESPVEKQNQQDAAGLAVTDFIRRRSEAGLLVTAEEIYGEFLRMGILTEKENQPAELEAFLKKTVKQNEELKEVLDGKGLSHYYSVQSMAETYARILIQREGDPLLLMAEVIRENSQRYPRPVPLNIFEDAPFELTPEQILFCLKKMADEKEYQDIEQTTTSIGTVFLYSRQYLEPDHAAMLAEWLDVGQSNNP